MGQFVKGDVVILPFPFSDLSASKKRPALVLVSLAGNDMILCQITSKAVANSYAIPLDADDFVNGSLHQASNIRPERLFTADSRIVASQAGSLTSAKMQEVVAKITQLLML